jgi:pilus assembly protein CpaE
MWHVIGKSEDGAAATEFALVAPLFVIALLGAVDLAVAEYDHMQLDHVTRAAAQIAQADPGITAVSNAAQRLAETYFPKASLPQIVVKKYCACPEAPDTELASCDFTCQSPTGIINAPYIFYSFSAQRQVKLIYLSSFNLHSTAKVQIR